MMNKEITIGEKYGPAMEITTQSEADAYFELCVQHTMSWGKTREEAEQIERQNLGYYAGYYSPETQRRVNKFFHCSHPILGATEQMTPEELLKAGMDYADSMAKNN